MADAALAKLIADLTRMVATVARESGADDAKVEEIAGKVSEIASGLEDVAEQMEEMRDRTLPRQERFPIADYNKDQIYVQCVSILDGKISKLFPEAYPEYDYHRFTVLGKDDYGNITDGEVVVKAGIFLTEDYYEVVVGFPLMDGYVVEPLFVEYNGERVLFENLRKVMDEIESYKADYCGDELFKPNFLDRPMSPGPTAEDSGQKAYSAFANPDPPTTMPATTHRYNS